MQDKQNPLIKPEINIEPDTSNMNFRHCALLLMSHLLRIGQVLTARQALLAISCSAVKLALSMWRWLFNQQPTTLG
jgi:hypothetical protein